MFHGVIVTGQTDSILYQLIGYRAIEGHDFLEMSWFAEIRHRQGIQGDSAHDWLEAERQLVAEAKSKKSS